MKKDTDVSDIPVHATDNAGLSLFNPPTQEQSSVQVITPPDDDAEKTRRKTNKLCLPAEDEQKIADWYRENPIFSDRTMRDYKDQQKKTRLMEEMAATLSVPCTAQQLKKWLESMRTYVGKLMKVGPSGTAMRNLTGKMGVC